MSNVKGSSLLHRQAFVTQRRGAVAWQRLLASLPEADARALSPRILSSAWYPFELYNRLDQAICRQLAGGDLGYCREIGADSARRALSGTYRVYLKDGPAALLRRLAVLHRTLHDDGTLQVSSLGEGQCVLRATYVPASSRTNCLVAEGFYRTVVELCGGTAVAVSEGNCSARGAPFCLFNVRWSPGASSRA